jgi:hypothetical protein
VLALTLALAAASPAAAVGGGGALPAAPPPKIDILQSVAAKPGSTWAVGYSWNPTAHAYQPLIEHWKSGSWRLAVGARLTGKHTSAFLQGVCALSASNAWAVGYVGYGNITSTLIEHWNGRAWQRIPSPNVPGKSSFLYSVAATSPTSAWAIGYYRSTATLEETLIEHWNGKAWKRVPSPNVAGRTNLLLSVTAPTPSSTWAVGYSQKGGAPHTLAERWSAGKWKIVPSPNPGGQSNFQGVSAISPGSVWAVGQGFNGANGVSLTAHWTGGRWHVIASPIPSGATGAILASVAVTSAKSALTVGYYRSNGSADQTLAERLSSGAWTVTPSQNPGGLSLDNDLNGVAATSMTNAWAVGTYQIGSSDLTLIEHWDGNAWTQVPSPNP